MDASLFIGLMSGTSLDGVDAALLGFAPDGSCSLQGHCYLALPQALHDELLSLNSAGENEIERSHLAGNQLARYYAVCVQLLMQQLQLTPDSIIAIGAHGQTIRHRPDLGFTVQIGNAALLAELTSISVVSDFRSRDVAAGGQGAPLVPAFHQAVFASPEKHRVIVNIGGISNLSDLPPTAPATGFDCGVGNLLMNGWAQRHIGSPYDDNGDWAASGTVIPELLSTLLGHAFFGQKPPKSTGRDTFNMPWLHQFVKPHHAPRDVQATLLELAAVNIMDAISAYCANAEEIYLCGGGAHNGALVARLRQLSGDRKLSLTDELGIGIDWVEAAAFAWLARQTMLGLPGNLPAVTGACGPRILGSIHPA